jgi:hypothetical protein
VLSERLLAGTGVLCDGSQEADLWRGEVELPDERGESAGGVGPELGEKERPALALALS